MIPWFKRRSIHTLIATLVLAVAVPLAAMFAWILAENLERARATAQREVRHIAEDSAMDIESVLRKHKATLGRLAARPSIARLDAKRCDPAFVDYVSLYPEFYTLGLRDLEANIVCSFQPNPPAADVVATLPWFVAAKASETFLASNAFLGPTSGRWVSVITHPVRDEAGRSVGLLALTLDLRKLGEEVFTSIPGNAVVRVLDRNFATLMRSGESEAFLGKPGPSRAKESTQGVREGFLTQTGLDGVTRLNAFVTIPGVEWRVVAGMPEADVLADYYVMLRKTIALYVGVLMLVAVLAWRIGLSIVTPVANLAGTVEKVANGDKTARAQDTALIEIDSVTQQFNQMLDALNQHEGAILSAKRRLRATLDAIPDLLFEVGLDGRIFDYHSHRSDLLSVAPEAFLNRKFSEILPPDAAQVCLSAIEEASANGWSIGSMYALQLPQGEHWFELSVSPMGPHASEDRHFICLARDITNRKLAEARIENLSRRLVQGQEEIRRRFSRELHDRTSPNLAALRINLDIIANASPQNFGTQDYADRVDDTRALIEDTTISIRQICAELHLPALDRGGLLGVVKSYAQQFTKRTGLQVQVNCPHQDIRLPTDLELGLFRIVQEAMTNCAKHANARVIVVNLQFDANPKRLSIADDGVGFDVGVVDAGMNSGGMGLLSMKETAEFAGGTFRVDSAPDGGTCIYVEV